MSQIVSALSKEIETGRHIIFSPSQALLFFFSSYKVGWKKETDLVKKGLYLEKIVLAPTE